MLAWIHVSGRCAGEGEVEGRRKQKVREKEGFVGE